MITVLTLCSSNYLAHAKTLGNSLAEHDPDVRLVIGLVDRVSKDIAPEYWHPNELIPVEDLGISEFEEMRRKYNVVELNTAVKPFYMEYLYRRDPAVEAVIYLDPDILVCSSLRHIFEKLRTSSIIVTPHSCSYDDSPINIYYEGCMLGTGIYNLGFIATSRSETVFAFLRWWQKRLRDHCFYRPGSGAFVDQLWVVLASVYFSGVLVEKDPGYNMCYWNHFERRLTVQNGRYFVNERHPLVFYHFSSYDPMNPSGITKRKESRTETFENRPDLKPIYDDYGRRLLANGFDRVRTLPYALEWIPPPEKLHKRFLKNTVRVALRATPQLLQMKVKRLAEFTAACVQ